MTYTINVHRTEDYSGEHRDWIETYTLPEELVNQIIADAAPSPPPGWRLVPDDPTTVMFQAGQRASGRHAGDSTGDIYRAMLEHAPTPPTGLDAAALIRFMADFCDNCHTADGGSPDTAAGNEQHILKHFRDGVPGWASAAAIQSGGTPESHM